MKNKERISSLYTFIFKYIFGILWSGGFGYSTFRILFYTDLEVKWLFLFAWFIGSYFILRAGINLKYIAIENDHLIISNYLKKIKIPISEIDEISENCRITFKQETVFGKKIKFIPKTDAFGKTHPKIDYLRSCIKKSQANNNC